jgi:hypothetical protein
MPEVRKDQFLKGFNLVLQTHEVGYSFIPTRTTERLKQHNVRMRRTPH